MYKFRRALDLQGFAKVLQAILLCLFVTCVLATRVMAQTAPPDLSQMPTSTLEAEASKLIGNKAFASAIPLLQELANRFKGTGNPELQTKLEGILYFLGVGFMQTEKIEEAAANFETYMTQFAKGNHARHALELMGDCYRRVEDFDKASAAYERLQVDYQMDQDTALDVMTKLAGCYISQTQWAKAIPLLETVWKQSYNNEIRGKAATALTRAYIETDKIDEISALLPELLGRSSSRYDIEFNLALVQGGDKMFHAKRFPIALLFYQLTLSGEDLLKWMAEQEKRLGEDRKGAMSMGGDLAHVLEIDGKIAKLKTERKTLQETESYTEELRLRIARVYFEMGRKWESLWTFWSVWKDFPKSPLAEQGLYGAFQLAGEMGFDERAIELGLVYLKDYEKSGRYDEVSLQMGQIYTKRQEFDKTIGLYQKVLEIKPDHSYADQLAFTTGYTLFQMEQFDRALESFSILRKKFPNSNAREACDYWMGLTYLFKRDYKNAKDEFADFVSKYSGGDYFEDASFRIGVCHYGLLEFPEARKKFEEFVRVFPTSSLRGEAHVMLGDIAGADGRLDDAVKEYKTVERYTQSMVHVNYATFQIGKIQEMRKDFKGMAEFFQKYLQTYGLKGNYTEAIWRIGFAKKAQGDTVGMLDDYLAAIKKYGDDPSAIGIDLIIDEWPNLYKTFYAKEGKDPADVLKAELTNALAKKTRAMSLRLQMALFKLFGAEAKAPTFVVEDLQYGSPAVLLWIGEQTKNTHPDLARKAYQRVLDVYDQTEWSEKAMVEMAEMEATAKAFPKALVLFRQVQERFPTSPNAGLAMKREGDMLREQKKFKDAMALYEKILQVKDWRGPLWAEALYQTGMCRIELSKEKSAVRSDELKKAAAYFERVYVLYQNYTEWVARSYLKRGECLVDLGMKKEAIDVYQAFKTESELKEKLKATPEAKEIEQRLAKLL